ncbi:MAG: DUF2232 domain-containing protein [Pseudomonadota bacterium]
MTRQAPLIAAISGMASLLLFLAAARAGFLALPLFLLIPLPIVIASLGWGTVAGFLSAFMAFVAIAVITDPRIALFYGFDFALPAAYLAHCLGLSRRDDNSGAVEWFPISRVFFRMVLYGAFAVGLSLAFSGFDPEVLERAISEQLVKAPQNLGDGNTVSPDEAARSLVALYTSLLPFAAPVMWLLMIGFNLWLGARIVKRSGKMDRPNLEISEISLPPLALLALAIGIILALVDPPLYFIGASLVATLAMAITILGYNTVHVLLEGTGRKPLVLPILYLATIFFSFPLLLMFLLGLADFGLKLRDRYRAQQNQSNT